MNFTQYKNEIFDGDEEKAISQLAYEGYYHLYKTTETGPKLQEIIDTMDKREAHLYLDCFNAEVDRNPDMRRRTLAQVRDFTTLGMEIEEFERTEKNPFVKRFWLDILALVGILALLGVLVAIKRIAGFESTSYDTLVTCVIATLGTLGSARAGNDLVKIFKFKKYKKILNREDQFDATKITTVPDAPVDMKKESAPEV